MVSIFHNFFKRDIHNKTYCIQPYFFRNGISCSYSVLKQKCIYVFYGNNVKINVKLYDFLHFHINQLNEHNYSCFHISLLLIFCKIHISVATLTRRKGWWHQKSTRTRTRQFRSASTSVQARRPNTPVCRQVSFFFTFLLLPFFSFSLNSSNVWYEINILNKKRNDTQLLIAISYGK